MSPRLETSPSLPNQCVLILSQIQDLEVLLNVMAQTNDCSHQSYNHYRIHSQQQYLHHPNHTHTNQNPVHWYCFWVRVEPLSKLLWVHHLHQDCGWLSPAVGWHFCLLLISFCLAHAGSVGLSVCFILNLFMWDQSCGITEEYCYL